MLDDDRHWLMVILYIKLHTGDRGGVVIASDSESRGPGFDPRWQFYTLYKWFDVQHLQGYHKLY